jgi:hypothetical protein
LEQPSREELLALLRKYETLAELRRERAAGGAAAERSVLRALAREFPGALRELDTVTLDDIDTRRAALGAASAGGAVEPWMTWMVAYHATMRAALVVKARLSRARHLSDAIVANVREEASRRTGLSIDEAFVQSVARPPHGRLNRAVFERLGQNFGVSPDEIWQALFPARRTGRYERTR